MYFIDFYKKRSNKITIFPPLRMTKTMLIFKDTTYYDIDVSIGVGWLKSDNRWNYVLQSQQVHKTLIKSWIIPPLSLFKTYFFFTHFLTLQ